ncbi:MAG TPA: hypothetical protein VKU00_19485 [Chthonomonadaceae bacterium]|nr:hypothetical protein [Chthonomonadaceae bacterium]
MPRAEIILLQFDIAGHSRIQIPPVNLQKARKLLQRYVSALVEVQASTTVMWAGDGGWCWFKVDEATNFTWATDAAIDILAMVPRINEILLRDDIIRNPLEIRISADTMNVELDDDPTHFCAEQMNKFLKYERNIGLVSSLVITRRIYQHLQFAFQERFNKWRNSPELETDLYVYDGKKIRNETLKRVVNQSDDSEDHVADFVQVTIFEGDQYQELVQHAYADVELSEEPLHVEAVRFLAFRNALANAVIDSASEYDNQREFLLAAAESPYDVLREIRYEPHRRTERDEGLRETSKAQADFNPIGRAIGWCTEGKSFRGGEELRFFNASALGFVAEIGDNTLLDHVFAGTLLIRSITGGVERHDDNLPLRSDDNIEQ